MPRKRGFDRRPKGEMPLPDENEGTMICVVQRNIGGGYLEVLCTDGEVYMARIPGKMRRRVWMNPGDVILFQPWGTSDNKGDVVYKYFRDEVRKLIERGYITEEFLEETIE